MLLIPVAEVGSVHGAMGLALGCKAVEMTIVGCDAECMTV